MNRAAFFIFLASTVLIDRGDLVWIEDPGSPRARGVLTATDAQVVPVPIDLGYAGIDYLHSLLFAVCASPLPVS